MQSWRYPFRVVGGSCGSNPFGLVGRGSRLSCVLELCWRTTVVNVPQTLKPVRNLKGFRVNSSWIASSLLASTVFIMGTIAVLPFHMLKVAAPKAEMTRKCIRSSVMYIVLSLVYAYLLYLSWTPGTLRLMFASKYWLPEPASRHIKDVLEPDDISFRLDSLARRRPLRRERQIFQDGLENEIETRHSVSLCLLFCPVGITAHFITKALMERARSY